jgi:hypothetical protein
MWLVGRRQATTSGLRPGVKSLVGGLASLLERSLMESLEVREGSTTVWAATMAHLAGDTLVREFHVLAVGEQQEVVLTVGVLAIVQPVVIAMMDVFGPEELSTQSLLHDPAMFQQPAALTRDLDLPVLFAIDLLDPPRARWISLEPGRRVGLVGPGPDYGIAEDWRRPVTLRILVPTAVAAIRTDVPSRRLPAAA